MLSLGAWALILDCTLETIPPLPRHLLFHLVRQCLVNCGTGGTPMKLLRTDFSNISGALSSAFTPLPSQPCCLNGAGHWDRIPMTKELAENVSRAEIEMCVDLLEEGRAEWSGERKQTEMLWAGSEQDDEELGNSWWMSAKTCWAETGQIPCV